MCIYVFKMLEIFTKNILFIEDEPLLLKIMIS